MRQIILSRASAVFVLSVLAIAAAAGYDRWYGIPAGGDGPFILITFISYLLLAASALTLTFHVVLWTAVCRLFSNQRGFPVLPAGGCTSPVGETGSSPSPRGRRH